MLLFNKNKLTKFINIMFVVCLISSCCNPQIQATNMPKNSYRVSDDLVRSDQPTAEEMQVLAQLGFKTIINLRQWHSDEAEMVNTKLTGITVKMSAGKITDAQVIEALQAIHRNPKPVLIHCWRGSDRTGLVVAMYRIVFQNWTKPRAIEELMNPKFGHHYNVYSNIVKYIENVDVEKIRAAVFN